MKSLYVIAVAYDEVAIAKTIFQANCDKVCLLSTKIKPDKHRKDSDLRTQEVEKALVKKLDGLVEVDVLRFNWHLYDEMIGVLVDYIKEHKGWDITINFKFGSTRLTPILLMIASLYGLQLDYTFTKELRADLLKGDWHEGFHAVERVPTFPLSVDISEKGIRLLQLISDKPGFSVQDYVQVTDGDETKVRAEFNYYVGKLLEKGMVQETEEKKKHVVGLTDLGVIVLKSKG